MKHTQIMKYCFQVDFSGSVRRRIIVIIIASNQVVSWWYE